MSDKAPDPDQTALVAPAFFSYNADDMRHEACDRGAGSINTPPPLPIFIFRKVSFPSPELEILPSCRLDRESLV